VARRIKETGCFTFDDLEVIRSTFEKYDFAPNTPWDYFRDAFLLLPDWFDRNLDPLSEGYFHQQERLWREISGTDAPYDPFRDEKEAPRRNVDAIRFPGFFCRRDPLAVSEAAVRMERYLLRWRDAAV